jgi:hypothetical protein
MKYITLEFIPFIILLPGVVSTCIRKNKSYLGVGTGGGGGHKEGGMRVYIVDVFYIHI